MRLRPLHFLPFILLLASLGTHAAAQDSVRVRNGFIADSIRVGEPTAFYLAAHYPSTLNIVFPDSTYGFAPFEYERKRYFTTQTNNGISYDSVVYYLSTFEIDAAQTLGLPIFQLNPTDSVVYTADADTIFLVEMVKNLPDSTTLAHLPLKANNAYHKVPYSFNWDLLAMIVTGLLVLGGIFWVAFGEKYLKRYRLKKLQQAHQKFRETFNVQLTGLRSTFSSLATEHALTDWKKYMEQLDARPYTKLTSRETMRLDATLGNILHALDGAIYGHNTQVVEPLEMLRTIADKRFESKLEELKHGQRR